MHTPFTRSRSLLIALSLASFAYACGGREAAHPESAPAASEAAPSEPEARGPATTTTELGDGGDLQGAKLETSSETTVATGSTAGPKKGSGPEPGRGSKDIQAMVAARRDEARACYDAGQKKNPKLEGDLDVKWVIDPEGNVTDAAVDASRSSILDEEVGKCVVEVIKKLRFAKSEKGFESRVHYPFNFHPKQAPRGADAGR